MVEKRKNSSTPWKDSIKLDSNKIAKITVILNLNLMFPVTLFDPSTIYPKHIR